jgi:hypothetical protein
MRDPRKLDAPQTCRDVEEEAPVVFDVVNDPPCTVETRFALVAPRMLDAWIRTRRVEVSAGDLRIARQFLERVGVTVQEVPGVLVRLVHHDGRAEEMTREAAVMMAVRCLARKL